MPPNFPKLRLHRCQHLPDFVRMLLDSERSEAYPERYQQRQQGSRPRYHNVPLALKGIYKTRTPDDLRKQALGRQEQHGEIRRVRRVNVLLADRSR